MNVHPSVQIFIKKASDALKKCTELVSFTTLGILLGVSFMLATVISVSTSGVLFSIQNEPGKKVTKRTSVGNLNQESSLSDGDMKIVLDRNIFNSEGTLGDETDAPKEETAIPEDGMVKSSLPLKLLGTIYGGDPFSGIAMVENTRKKTTNSFLVGQALMIDVAIVRQILKEKIVFENNGRLEFIELEKKELVRRKRGSKTVSPVSSQTGPMSSIKPATGRLNKFKEDGYEFSEDKIKMTDAYKKKLLTTDFSKVLQDAKAEPNMVDGQLKGFKLTRIRDDSIYQKSGLANGDIVTEINGVELSSASQAIRTLQSLRTAKQIEVTVLQNGVSKTLEISIGQ